MQLTLDLRVVFGLIRPQRLKNCLFEVLIQELGDLAMALSQNPINSKIKIGFVELEELAKLQLQFLEIRRGRNRSFRH
ncbi:MAG: hypothetical protein LAP61_22830 [Acidobacteriia bacterium]|nr:hypothetical protein [Terriglobia bacterium]